MKAKRCNRCMAFFDPTEGRGETRTVQFKNPMIRTWKDIQEGKIGAYLEPNGGADEIIDLCPACANDFIEFMDFPNRRIGYIQEYEAEIDDLRNIVDHYVAKEQKQKDDKNQLQQDMHKAAKMVRERYESMEAKESISDFIEGLFDTIFGPVHSNRKPNNAVCEDPKGNSNKR